MKTTKLGLLAFLGLGVFAYGQETTNGKMGINTTGPRATLEIRPSTAGVDYETSGLGDNERTNEGVLIPQLTKARAMRISNKVDGTLVYVKEDVGAGDTAFIGTGKGFYYWNGSDSKWVKLGADVASSASVSAANGLTANGGTVELGGTLTKATTVTQNNNDMTFTTGTGRTIVNGTFQTKGAVYANARLANLPMASSDWTSSDYAVVLAGGGAATLALPDPKVNKRRVIAFSNQSTTSTVNIISNPPVNNSTIEIGKGFIVVSVQVSGDEQNNTDVWSWYVIGGY
ncbi:hypothetical protein [Bergeyella sp. RCAD1439]|uniref:hypothetical protein n=1 Tax=Bergeyella anatis TaxID=3113737 RepID=UPI002E196CA4|nr:hypothetical protein [Bergeyella sp. RCAD1439]